ncbi:undecaprenyl/decaprenyl-phosphate alpha-N-acetylglucosaminyl 1-phosphate transferase [Synechococcus sp. Nb3U1]|uniref:MraY family glycosyltransferase n=1 Tax=Synechococcus sp. Nb3U1 TaxID=1914529 RepID=UPI001F3EB784|nr:MraY family glycosyltransferase [Synechococcus sp. Nb3U1]MCF2970470.1 undecaprenyl/decaprenyl-phosphate alpha-N-acetylglucosaminyl 1-phosphate transferase [Synechococcus sp. Nb3U1]
MPYLVAFLAAACVVLWATPMVKAVGIRSGQLDLPDERKIHQQPMVRLGGISIFCGNLVALLLLWGAGAFGGLRTEQEYEIWGVTIGGVLFFLIGLADDLFRLSPFSRLLMQFTVATAAWGVGVRIEFVSLPVLGTWFFPAWLSLLITLFWLVGMANAINFMDGLDGLAAGVSGIAAVAMLIVTLLLDRPSAAMIAAALAGACLGFLRYNFNPAQIFMGDGGAYFLGFTLAGIGVIGVAKVVTTLAVALPFCILAVPILDMSTVILKRLSRGQSPFHPDKGHLHHRLLKAGLSQRHSVLLIYAMTLWVGSLALALAGLPAGGTYLGGASLVLGGVAWGAWQRHRQPTKRIQGRGSLPPGDRGVDSQPDSKSH